LSTNGSRRGLTILSPKLAGAVGVNIAYHFSVETGFLHPLDTAFSPVVRAVGQVLQQLKFTSLPNTYFEHAENSAPAALLESLRSADVLIADVSQKQPGMLFELGYAHALGKPIILLLSTEAAAGLPLDLAAFQVITYNPRDLASLTQRLSTHLTHLNEARVKGGRL
jgi:nucleoside 2-deoxyribosyltransferase